jgi:hypothetical protein
MDGDTSLKRRGKLCLAWSMGGLKTFFLLSGTAFYPHTVTTIGIIDLDRGFGNVIPASVTL